MKNIFDVLTGWLVVAGLFLWYAFWFVVTVKLVKLVWFW
jgi:hypothetical protein